MQASNPQGNIFYGIKVVKGFYNFVFIAFIVYLNFHCVLIQTSQAISFI